MHGGPTNVVVGDGGGSGGHGRGGGGYPEWRTVRYVALLLQHNGYFWVSILVVFSMFLGNGSCYLPNTIGLYIGGFSYIH